VARPRSPSGYRCEGKISGEIARESGDHRGCVGASSADLKKKQSNSIDVGLASPRDKPRTSREPLSGRSQGPQPHRLREKAREWEKGKTSTWARVSPERQKLAQRWGRGPARSPRGFYEGNPTLPGDASPIGFGKKGESGQGKTSTWPRLSQRDKRLFDDGGGAPHEVPEASMRGIRKTPAAEPGSILASGEGGGLPDGPSWPGRGRPLDAGARRTSRIDL